MTKVRIRDCKVGDTVRWSRSEWCRCTYRIEKLVKSEDPLECEYSVVNIQPCNQSSCGEVIGKRLKGGSMTFFGGMTFFELVPLSSALERVESE